MKASKRVVATAVALGLVGVEGVNTNLDRPEVPCSNTVVCPAPKLPFYLPDSAEADPPEPSPAEVSVGTAAGGTTHEIRLPPLVNQSQLFPLTVVEAPPGSGVGTG